MGSSWKSHANEVGRGNHQKDVVRIHFSHFEGQRPQSHVSEESYWISPRISPFEDKEYQKESQMKCQQEHFNLLTMGKLLCPILEVYWLRLCKFPVEVICHQKVSLCVFEQKLKSKQKLYCKCSNKINHSAKYSVLLSRYQHAPWQVQKCAELDGRSKAHEKYRQELLALQVEVNRSKGHQMNNCVVKVKNNTTKLVFGLQQNHRVNIGLFLGHHLSSICEFVYFD